MKIPEHERKPLVVKKKRASRKDPNSIKRRAERDGFNGGTICSRMKRHGLTYEEAIVYVPEDKAQSARRGSRNSFWRKEAEAHSRDLEQKRKELKARPFNEE